ncbi:hypothetical protein Vau01_121270 [Virgisporangium aurantiacum]|uniref:Uncharacterized protein n=1 Tax=Virgisporangium aurantiacum TaxID=175570 RepID=A0A8J3ZN61_9ACTN|nr:hypothetical protein Vau01_121270 [Virgisporangium aurantiacum]
MFRPRRRRDHSILFGSQNEQSNETWPLDAAAGDIVTVPPASGGHLLLRVAGTVYDPSLAPSGQEQTRHAHLATALLAGASMQRTRLTAWLRSEPARPVTHFPRACRPGI